jgi:dihydroxyacetone kinase-like predicted kinase
VLEDAGVVDSGGQGLYRVLEGMLQVGSADAAAMSSPRLEGASAVLGDPADPHAGQVHVDHADGTDHGYETQYMLTSLSGYIDVPSLREAIEAVGDSVVVAGDERRSRVHVHGERPDLAIGAGLPYGRLSHVEILDLDHQVADLHTTAAPVAKTDAPKIAIVAATAAPGVAAVFTSFGAQVVQPQDGTRPSVSELASAIEASGAEAAIVLPNDRDAVLAARLASSLTGNVTVKVIPTRNAAEGIAAVLAFDPEASVDENVTRLEAESSAVRSFSVFTAAKDAVVDGQSIKDGEIIALDAERGLLATGVDVTDTAMLALDQLDDFDLVTVYRGIGYDAETGEAFGSRIEGAGWGVDVEIVDGGMPHDHLLVAVE